MSPAVRQHTIIHIRPRIYLTNVKRLKSYLYGFTTCHLLSPIFALSLLCFRFVFDIFMVSRASLFSPSALHLLFRFLKRLSCH